MQFAKDSFFLALQQRLAGLNPERMVTINGATVPAVVVVENLPPSSAEPQANAFYIEWGAADVVDGHAGSGALMSLECVVSYYTLGTVASMVDRGRVLGQLDDELLAICNHRIPRRGITRRRRARIWARQCSGASRRSLREKETDSFGGA